MDLPQHSRSSLFVLILLLSCTLTLTAQKEFKGQKKDFNSNSSRALYNKHFTSAELYTLDAKAISQFAKSGDRNLEMRMRMGNRFDWDLNLVKRDLYSDNYISKVGSATGVEVVENSKATTTFGYLRDGSGTATMTFAENFIYGSITKDGKEFFIEPARFFDDSADDNTFVIYDRDNVIPGHGTCGVTETTKHKPGKRLKSGNRSDCRIAEFAHAADYSMYLSHGSDVAMTNNYIAGVINNVQLDYNQFGLEYQIVETYVHTTSATSNPWASSNLTTSSISALDLLDEFTVWGNGGGFNNVFDLAQLWTDKNIDNGLPPGDPNFSTAVVGLADLNVVCNPGYSLIEDFTTNSTSMRVTVSHEFGHNFGCNHNYVIGSACDPPGRPAFIMDPVVGGSTCWSDGTAACDINSTLTIETNILSFNCLDGQVNSGKEIELTACTDETNPIMLSDFLIMENSGGSWSVNPSGLTPTSGFDIAGTFIPAGNSPGIYLFDYSVSGSDVNPVNCSAVGDNASGHCNVTTTLIFNLIDLQVGQPILPVPTLCNTTSNAFSLLGALSGASAGGTWTVNGAGQTPTSGFDPEAGTFDALGNPIGFYAFDYTKMGTLIPGATALQCSANEVSTDGAIFGPDTYGAIASPTPVGCMPDSRTMDCVTFTLEVDITAYNGAPGQAKISVRPSGCGLTGAIARFTMGVGTYSFTEANFPPGFDPSAGFCVIVHDNAQWIATDIQFVADLVIDYPSIPDTGCEDMMSTLMVNVDSCTPPMNDNCTTAIYLQCADAITVSTTSASSESLPDCSNGGTNSNFSNTAWYRFTGTGETFQISTCNSLDDYSQELHLYTGNCGGLTCIAIDEGSCVGSALPELTFNSIAGTEYFIMIGRDGTDQPGGSLTLEFSCGNCIDRGDINLSPPNDFVSGDILDIETNQNIIADNIINAGADIMYDGDQSILMNPNFEVKLGATYLAIPDGCGGVSFREKQTEKK